MSPVERARVAVTGVGQSGPVAADPRSIPEMVLVAVEAALGDAALGWDEIDAVVTASVDLFDGSTASNVALTEVVGAVMKPETRIAGDGLCAAIHAACQIRAGAYRTVLVVAHGKASMAPQAALQPWAMDPIFLQPLGVDFRTVAGLEARRLLAREPAAAERWACLAARRRASAAARGVAGPITAEEVLASPVQTSPLTCGMEAPAADAAYAVVLQATHRPGPSVRLTGVGHDLEAHSPGERPLGAWVGLRRAFERACLSAGLEDRAHAGPVPMHSGIRTWSVAPRLTRRECTRVALHSRGEAPRHSVALHFGLLEPSCRYPHEEDLVLDAVGAGDVSDAVVSPGGGLFAGDAPCAAGLGRLVDALSRLRREPALGRALAHGAWGPAGQGQAVVILEAA